MPLATNAYSMPDLQPSNGEQAMQYILVAGNISDGHTFYGPFDSFDDADEYSRDFAGNDVTWITELREPKNE